MKERVYLKDHIEKGIGTEVHVEHFGVGPFFYSTKHCKW